MQITQVWDKTKEELSVELLEKVKGEYDTVYDPYETDTPLAAIIIDAHDGDNNGTKETIPQ